MVSALVPLSSNVSVARLLQPENVYLSTLATLAGTVKAVSAVFWNA